MDQLMGELKAVRESQELHSGMHSDLDNEIKRLKIEIRRVANRLGRRNTS